MTQQEIAREMMRLVLEDAKRPAEEQFREMVERGVIDEKGRVHIGDQCHVHWERNGSSGASTSRKASRNGKPARAKSGRKAPRGKGKRKA